MPRGQRRTRKRRRNSQKRNLPTKKRLKPEPVRFKLDLVGMETWPDALQGEMFSFLDYIDSRRLMYVFPSFRATLWQHALDPSGYSSLSSVHEQRVLFTIPGKIIHTIDLYMHWGIKPLDGVLQIIDHSEYRLAVTTFGTVEVLLCYDKARPLIDHFVKWAKSRFICSLVTRGRSSTSTINLKATWYNSSKDTIEIEKLQLEEHGVILRGDDAWLFDRPGYRV